MSYAEERQKVLLQLEQLGVKAPAAMLQPPQRRHAAAEAFPVDDCEEVAATDGYRPKQRLGDDSEEVVEAPDGYRPKQQLGGPQQLSAAARLKRRIKLGFMVVAAVVAFGLLLTHSAMGKGSSASVGEAENAVEGELSLIHI